MSEIRLNAPERTPRRKLTPKSLTRSVGYMAPTLIISISERQMKRLLKKGEIFGTKNMEVVILNQAMNVGTTRIINTFQLS